MACARCGHELPPAAAQCPSCGLPTAAADGVDDAVATIIPFKNPPALMAYYLGLFGFVLSCVPILGLGMSIAALVLGLKGLQVVRRVPKAHGTGHAWFGIIAGTLGILVGLATLALVVVAATGALVGPRR